MIACWPARKVHVARTAGPTRQQGVVTVLAESRQKITSCCSLD